MRFRETLWFKKGLSDAEAIDLEIGDEAPPPANNLLPIEDRYLDDGTLEPADSFEFGVHTGATQSLVKFRQYYDAGVREDALIREMKRGRRPYLALIAVLALIGGSLPFIT